MANILEVILSAQEIRIWCKANLPFYESVVCYDLVIFIAVRSLKNESITVKHVFDALPHSYTAIRQHYMRLISDGWIVVISDSPDQRIKHIKTTTKFDEIIEEYARIHVSLTPEKF